MRGYTDEAEVQRALGRDLTADESSRFEAVAAAAELEIERLTGMVWPSATVTVASAAVPVTGELHRLDYGPTIQLKSAPLDSVDSAVVRLRGTTTSRTLEEDTDYEVDLGRGRLYLVTPYVAHGYRWLVAAYTPSIGVPDAIRQATALLTAARLSGAPVAADFGRFESVQVGEDVFKFRAPGEGMTTPPAVEALLAAYRPPVLV